MLIENLKILGVVIGTLAVFTLIANSIPQIQSEVPAELTFSADVTEAELVSAGEILYNGAGACAACHGLAQRAPNLLSDEDGSGSIGLRCGDRVNGQDCKTYLYKSMTEPSDYLVEGYGPIMPDMRRSLSNAQIWAIVAFLQSRGGEVTVGAADVAGPADPAPRDPGAVGAGSGDSGTPTPTTVSLDPLEILRANACLTCHQLGGEGVALGPPFDSLGARLGADDIRSSILDPQAGASEGYEALVGVMPAIFGAQLTAAQLEVVVRFLADRR